MKSKIIINSILIIEDDELTASLYNFLLTELHICKNIVIKTEPEEGLEFIREKCLKNECPELIFIDLKMQGLTGFELIEEINKLKVSHNINCKIVILTSSSFIKDREKAEELSVDDYIIKPLSNEKILSLITKHFNI